MEGRRDPATAECGAEQGYEQRIPWVGRPYCGEVSSTICGGSWADHGEWDLDGSIKLSPCLIPMFISSEYLHVAEPAKCYSADIREGDKVSIERFRYLKLVVPLVNVIDVTNAAHQECHERKAGG